MPISPGEWSRGGEGFRSRCISLQEAVDVGGNPDSKIQNKWDVFVCCLHSTFERYVVHWHVRVNDAVMLRIPVCGLWLARCAVLLSIYRLDDGLWHVNKINSFGAGSHRDYRLATRDGVVWVLIRGCTSGSSHSDNCLSRPCA